MSPQAWHSSYKENLHLPPDILPASRVATWHANALVSLHFEARAQPNEWLRIRRLGKTRPRPVVGTRVRTRKRLDVRRLESVWQRWIFLLLEEGKYEQTLKGETKLLRYAAVQDEVDGGVDGDEAVGDVVQAQFDVFGRAVVVWKYGVVDEQNGHGRLADEKDDDGCH